MPPVEMIPKLVLESMDGSVSIPLDGTSGWIRMPGATGLRMPPTEVISAPIPGVPGSLVQDVRTQARPIFIPIYGRSAAGVRSFYQMLDQLHSLIDPNTGSFRLVGMSDRSVRELVVTYDGGLEGADGADSEGLSWCKVGLRMTAHDPYAQALTDHRLEFRVEATPTPFLGVAGGTDTPWPRALTSSSVIGTGMPVVVDSEVPVNPVLELTGPSDSFTGDLSPESNVAGYEWAIDIPTGVPIGSTLRLVTDPRARSVRLDGALAAGRIALGSKLPPFYPGNNVLNVSAPGSTEDTVIVLSWRNKFRSLW
jgi:hypothetical protein